MPTVVRAFFSIIPACRQAERPSAIGDRIRGEGEKENGAAESSQLPGLEPLNTSGAICLHYLMRLFGKEKICLHIRWPGSNKIPRESWTIRRTDKQIERNSGFMLSGVALVRI